MRTMLLLAGMLLAVPASGQSIPNKFGQSEPVPGSVAALKPLPERKDVVSWRVLAQVELVKVKDRFMPQYSANVAALDRKDVRMQGFMLPLDQAERQSHFVLSANPPTCSFCMPGGPESLVEVKMKKPLKYTMEPVVLAGRLSVLKDDPRGVFYVLSNAEPVK